MKKTVSKFFEAREVLKQTCPQVPIGEINAVLRDLKLRNKLHGGA